MRGSSFNLVYTAYSLEFGEEFVSLLFFFVPKISSTHTYEQKQIRGFFYETWNVFDNVRLPLRLINKCRFVKLSYHCINDKRSPLSLIYMYIVVKFLIATEATAPC